MKNFTLILVLFATTATGIPFVLRCWGQFSNWLNDNHSNIVIDTQSYNTADLGGDILFAAALIAMSLLCERK